MEFTHDEQEFLNGLPIGTEPVIFKDVLSGHQYLLPPIAVALYDWISRCEETLGCLDEGVVKTLTVDRDEALLIFKKHFPKEYGVIYEGTKKG